MKNTNLWKVIKQDVKRGACAKTRTRKHKKILNLKGGKK